MTHPQEYLRILICEKVAPQIITLLHSLLQMEEVSQQTDLRHALMAILQQVEELQRL